MWFGIITLFPEIFAALGYGITGRAAQQKLIELAYWNPREFTQDKQQRVDDRPYGGGPGMVMQVQPLRDAILAAKKAAPGDAKVLYLSPQGKLLQQADLRNLSQRQNLILLTGRYEGIDERLVKKYIDEEWSIGDYILTGGELAAMVMIDGIVRLLPGALGDPSSAEAESFGEVGLLDFPHYTRPAEIEGLSVPQVLQSGDHHAIQRWRLQQSLGRTWLRRPDLLAARELSTKEQLLLDEFKNSYDFEE